MKSLILCALFLFITDSTKVDSVKVKVDSLITIMEQQTEIVQLYKEQAAHIESINKKLKDPKVVKKLRKKLKK